MDDSIRRRRPAIRALAAAVIGWVAWSFISDASAANLQRQQPPLGCFQDQGDPQGTKDRDLSGSISSSASMTNDVCRAQCGSQGFKYAGTQAGTYCFCGNDYGKSGASQACTAPCSGDVSQTCGGIWANTVYPSTPPPPPQFTKPGRPAFGGNTTGSQPPPPAPPANGGQCVITIVGQGYVHEEVQRWEVTGPPTPSTAGQGMLYPLRWTATGHTGPSIISATAGDDLSVTRLANGSLLVNRYKAQVCVHGGVLTSPVGDWCEFPDFYPPATLNGNATRYDRVGSIGIGPGQPVNTWGIQKPPTLTGTAACEWHVTF